MAINTVTLSGNLGRDPEARFFESGTMVASFSLAATIYKQKENATVWIECKAWGGTGELIAEVLKKGSPVTVHGQLDYEEWTDSDGAKRGKHIVVVRDIQLPPRTTAKDKSAEPEAVAS